MAGLALASLPALASANAVLCSTHPGANGLKASDVTFDGSAADDCWGVGSSGGESSNPWASGVWTQLVVDNTPGDGNAATGQAAGVDFTLSATDSGTGTWSLGWKDTGPVNLPFTMDLVVLLSTSSGYASYLFDNQLFQMDGSGAGAFALTFTTAPLGYFAIYQANVTPITTVRTNAVPEPAALALVGVGLLAAAAFRRRRQRQSA